MSSYRYPFPVAISRFGEGETSRERQIYRAIDWLRHQPGDDVTVITPVKEVHSDILKRLIALPKVAHTTWETLKPWALDKKRVLDVWPNRERLNNLWGKKCSALAVIEWNEDETAEWIGDARPVQLYHDRTIEPEMNANNTDQELDLPGDVENALEQIARWAAGYSTGLKWNEIDKLKAELNNRPKRWQSVTVKAVRSKCRQLGMHPKDVDKIAELVQQHKDGRRFRPRDPYKRFRF